MSFAALLIGLAFIACLFLPGVLLNPALGVASLVGSLVVGDSATVVNNLLVHIVSPLLGAVLAVFAFRYLNPNELEIFVVREEFKA